VKRRLNATEDDGRIAAVAELRPAALNDLDDVYHYITTLQAPNAVRARIQKIVEIVDNYPANVPFLRKRQSNGQGALRAPNRPLEES